MLKKLRQINIREFLRYIFLSNSNNPNKVASAMSLGVFIAIIPIYGFQTVVAIALSHFLKLNKVIVLFASNISWPPIVFVLIYANYQTGYLLFNGRFNKSMDVSSEIIDLSNLGENLYLFLFGSVLFGLLFSGLTWVITRGILFSIKNK